MSNPIIFDTGAVIELFNKQEKEISGQIENFIADKPHSPRIIYEPNLVELVYKLVKKEKLLTPRDIKITFDYYGIEICPVPSDYSKKIHESYLSLKFRVVFDFADFFMCSAGLRLGQSIILTVDKRDLPNALSNAMTFFSSKDQNAIQLVPFPLEESKC